MIGGLLRFAMIAAGTFAALVMLATAQAEMSLTKWGYYGIALGAIVGLTVVMTVLTFGAVVTAPRSSGGNGIDPFARVSIGRRLTFYVAVLLEDARLCVMLAIPLSFVTEVTAIAVK